MVKPSDDLKKKYTTNPNAETIGEIAKITGLSETTVRRHAKKMVESKLWKEVITYRKEQGFVKGYIKI